MRTRQMESKDTMTTESNEWKNLVHSVLVATQTSSYQQVMPITSRRKAAQASKRKIRQIYSEDDNRSDEEMSPTKNKLNGYENEKDAPE